MRRPNGILILVFYFIAALVTGAALAPWLFKLGHWYAGIVKDFRLENTPPLAWLAEKCRDAEFLKYFNRALLVSALIWLWPLLRWARLGAETQPLERNRFRLQDTAVGFMLASTLLLMLGMGMVQQGLFKAKSRADYYQVLLREVPQNALEGTQRITFLQQNGFPNATLLTEEGTRPRIQVTTNVDQGTADSIQDDLKKRGLDAVRKPLDPASVPEGIRKNKSVLSALGPALLAAVCVSLLEEWFFRGVLFSLLLRTMRRVSALLFLSFFFAILHLLQPPESLNITAQEVSSGTGFWVVGQILARFGDAQFLLAEFSTLFIVGLILGYTRLATRSLWLAIGLHAGWVFGIKFFAGLADATPSLRAGSFLPWVGKDLKIGLLSLFTLTFTGLLVLAWIKLRAKALGSLPANASSQHAHPNETPAP